MSRCVCGLCRVRACVPSACAGCAHLSQTAVGHTSVVATPIPKGETVRTSSHISFSNPRASATRGPELDSNPVDQKKNTLELSASSGQSLGGSTVGHLCTPCVR